MSITLPKRANTVVKDQANIDESKILAVINKGGSPIQNMVGNQEIIKQINIKLLAKEIDSIKELRKRRPQVRGAKRLGISLHDWIIEAVNEKIERETKQKH